MKNLIKNINVFIILLLSYSTICTGQKALDSSVSFDFRKTRWQMSKDEVKAGETFKLIEENKHNATVVEEYGFDEELIFEGNITGSKFHIRYFFLNDKLINAMQLLVGYFDNKNIYIEEYLLTKELLIEKYGTPYIDNQIWQSDKFKGNEALALDAGDLHLNAAWENNRTRIDMELYKKIEFNRFVFMIIYVDNNLIHFNN